MFSVDTPEEADSLKVLLCKVGYRDGRYHYPGINGDLDAFEAAREVIRAEYAALQARRSPKQ